MIGETPQSFQADVNESTITLEDFAYQLPAELIAQDPAMERDKSCLLHYDRTTKKIDHHIFHGIVSILKPSDVLVVNNTKVIPVRLIGRRANGSSVEILLIKQESGQSGLWQAMASPLKRLTKGDIVYIAGETKNHDVAVEDIFIATDGQKRLIVRLNDPDKAEQTVTLLQDAGKSPLPPYIVQSRHNTVQSRHNTVQLQDPFTREKNDLERYQTIFAKQPGAIAAPTAGLHFSSSLLDQLKAKGVLISEITLHVGPGTFKPITTSIEQHIVESEWFAISKSAVENINAAKKQGRRIIAVGTTTCRALESAAATGELQATEGSHTSLFIKPGYKFRFIDGLLTNFHLSQSSLLLLVAAFMGQQELMRTYNAAIERRYRFYSYGDAMLIV